MVEPVVTVEFFAKITQFRPEGIIFESKGEGIFVDTKAHFKEVFKVSDEVKITVKNCEDKENSLKTWEAGMEANYVVNGLFGKTIYLKEVERQTNWLRFFAYEERGFIKAKALKNHPYELDDTLLIRLEKVVL